MGGTCGLCHSRRDVPSKSLGFSVQCHDHHLIECVVCKQEFDEYSPETLISDCPCCGNKHCSTCIGYKCAECNTCTFNTVLSNQSKCRDCKKNICRDCSAHCVECGYDFCRDDMKNHLMECSICGDIEICGMYHECPIGDYWTTYDEECNDCIFDACFMNKYCFNERRYKMNRKLNGYEKNK